MLARSFLFESSSKLLVTRTGIKAWSSSILGRIRPLILELLALEWRKFHTFEFEYPWSQLCSIIGVGERLHKVLGLIDIGTLDSGERSLPSGLLIFRFDQIILRNMIRSKQRCFYVKTTEIQQSIWPWFLKHYSCFTPSLIFLAIKFFFKDWMCWFYASTKMKVYMINFCHHYSISGASLVADGIHFR